MKRLVFLVMLVLALGLLPVAGQATTTTFTNETDFLNALTAYYTEDFNSLDPYSLGATQSFSNGVFSYTLSAQDGLFALGPGISTVFPDVPILGSSFASTGNPLTAIGGYFYLTDVEGYGVGGMVNVYVSGKGTGTEMFQGYVTTPQFFGVIDTEGIFSLLFTTDGTSGYYASISDLTVGDPTVGAVPLPPSILLLGSGLLGLLGFRRFKKI